MEKPNSNNTSKSPAHALRNGSKDDFAPAPVLRTMSPSSVRRGTVSDVRSLVKTAKICIEGFMEQKMGNGVWERGWFVLEAMAPELKMFAKKPTSDKDLPVRSILLDDVAQVLRTGSSNRERQPSLRGTLLMSQKHRPEDELSFSLCDASGQISIASFRCSDRSTLLWWLHGFQRRIFEQTKGILRKLKRTVGKEKSGSPLKGHHAATYVNLSSLFVPKPPKVTVTVTATITEETTTVVTAPAAGGKWLIPTQAAQQGRRKNMEDEMVVKMDLNAELGLDETAVGKLSLFAVFDGHAGRECAEYAAEFIVQNITEQPQFASKDIQGALHAAFVQTDSEFRKWAIENENISGSTAIVCLIRDGELFVANAGDCRAVISKAKKAIELSVDHKPHREDEKERIEKAGGWVESQEVLNIPKLYALGLEHTELLDEHQELVGWVQVHKVCGALAMTRSFGDILIKDLIADNFECAFETGFSGPLVLAEPEIRSHTIDSDDEFLLIACDGLYDVFTSQEAIEFIHGELSNGSCRDEIADKLITRAIELGTLDNVSVQIIFFDHNHRK